MGKYIKKSKTPREMTVNIMDSASQSYIGVRTRAKTLALQTLHKIPNSPSSSPSSNSSYLQLRSRRLHKSPNFSLANFSRKQKLNPKNANSNARTRSRPNSDSRLGFCSVAVVSRSIESESVNDKLNDGEVKEIVDKKKIEIHGSGDNVAEIAVEEEKEEEEASFGENLLDFEGRMSRESTPSSLIRKPESTRTPGSSTKASSTTNVRIEQQHSSPTDEPTASEVDDFFNSAEGEQQKQFIEKYNFDPIKDKPLPGRYEWEKFDR